MPMASAITWDMDLSMPMEMESAIIGAKIVPRVMVAETVKVMETAVAMARATVMAAETAMETARVAVITTAETDEKSKDLHLEVLFNIASPGPGR